MDAGVLEMLVRRSQMFHYSNKYLYLFTKRGFTKGCVDKAKEVGDGVLVTYEKNWKVCN